LPGGASVTLQINSGHVLYGVRSGASDAVLAILIS
jgi:hypothetical protein